MRPFGMLEQDPVKTEKGIKFALHPIILKPRRLITVREIMMTSLQKKSRFPSSE